MAQDSKIEWTKHTNNLWIGCTEVHSGCDNCLSPDTLVLKSDFNWVPIKSLIVGDQLLAFNEFGKSLRRYELSTVEKIWTVNSNAIEIITENSKIIASHNHRFLSGRSRNAWTRADDFSLKTALRYLPLVNNLKDSESYMRGYITGSTLGDGTMRFEKDWKNIPHRETLQRYWRIAVTATQSEFLERVSNYVYKLTGAFIPIKKFSNKLSPLMKLNGVKNISPMIQVGTRSTNILLKLFNIINNSKRDFDFKRGWLAGMYDAEGSYTKYKTKNGRIRIGALRIAQVNRSVLRMGIRYAKSMGLNFVLEDTRHCGTMRLMGGVETATKFISIIKPSLSYKRNPILNGFVYHKPDKVVSIKEIGKTKLIDIQTSTGTFIANGLMTHNCYARVLDNRWGGGHWGNESPRKIVKSVWDNFMKYQKLAKEANEIHRVFVGSMMDIFEKPMPLIDTKGNKVPDYTTDDVRQRYFSEIVPNTPNLRHLMLTKRPSNILKYIPDAWKENPHKNVMYGTSPVDQQTADTLIPQLLKVKGYKFLSVEPQLGEIILKPEWIDQSCEEKIDWLICGGESGHNKRPFDPDWARKLRDQCLKAGVPFFMKQWDKIKEIPDDLLIRQFPK